MNYNTTRTPINISSYGRNIQKLVQYAMHEISDKQERTRFCCDIVSIMENNRNIDKGENGLSKKLWNHLAIISDFKLDVEFPCEKQKPEDAVLKTPKKLKYPQKGKYNKSYGLFVKDFLKNIGREDDPDTKKQNLENLANYMKRAYYRENNVIPGEDAIKQIIISLSDNILELSENFQFSNNMMNKRKNPPKISQKAPQRRKQNGKHNGYKR